MDKKNLLISFSGGRTSGRMLYYLYNEWAERFDWNMLTVFANTGKEDEGTYKFIYDCMMRWNIPISWIEYQPATKAGWGVNPKLVDYKTASRNGEPFEEMIKLVGIPTTNAPFCSTILKARTIKAYCRSLGFTKHYTAIGIRNDEIDRVNPHWAKERIIYPLISMIPTTKQDIMDWWKFQGFDLIIDSDLGNCDCCWKKDLKRLQRIGVKSPEKFEWWQNMTDKYGSEIKRPSQANLKPPFNFYRGNLSPQQIISGEHKIEKPNHCSESCEPF